MMFCTASNPYMLYPTCMYILYIRLTTPCGSYFSWQARDGTPCATVSLVHLSVGYRLHCSERWQVHSLWNCWRRYHLLLQWWQHHQHCSASEVPLLQPALHNHSCEPELYHCDVQNYFILFHNIDLLLAVLLHYQCLSITQINNNGLLSFEAPVSDYTPRDFPIKATNVRGVGVAFIAPFWADVDTRGGLGTVFFRSTTSDTTLTLIKTVVSLSEAGFNMAPRFNPKWALVATWEEVGYYYRKGDMVSREGLCSHSRTQVYVCTYTP